MKRDPAMLGTLLVATVLIGCSTPTIPDPTPSLIEIVQRPDTLVAPGAAFDTVAVRVVDAEGSPLAGVLVEWSADGEVTPWAERTDEAGIARARWMLPGRTVTESSRPISRTGPSGQFAIAASVPALGSRAIRVSARPFTVDTLDAAFVYGCGLRGLELWCWGNLWILAPTEGAEPRRVLLPDGLVPRGIVADDDMLCVLDQVERLHCTVSGTDLFELIGGAPALRSITVTELSPNGRTMCGLAVADGAVWCWPARFDHSGGGSGRAAHLEHPGPYATLVGGLDATCGLDPDGRAHCWGGNNRGQLGDGTTTASTAPVAVSGARQFVTLAGGERTFCGAMASGEVWCWGVIGIGKQSAVPVRNAVHWVVGPDILVGQESEIYVFRNERVRVMWNEAEFVITDWFAPYRIKQFSLDWSACLRTLQDEVYCSWDLVNGGISESFFPQEPVPVPPPRNGW